MSFRTRSTRRRCSRSTIGPSAVSRNLPCSASRSAGVQAERDALQGRFRETADGPMVLREHRRLVDRVLKDMWRQLRLPAPLALLAVGGYGRGELYPHSDIDVLVLL